MSETEAFETLRVFLRRSHPGGGLLREEWAGMPYSDAWLFGCTVPGRGGLLYLVHGSRAAVVSPGRTSVGAVYRYLVASTSDGAGASSTDDRCPGTVTA